MILSVKNSATILFTGIAASIEIMALFNLVLNTGSKQSIIIYPQWKIQIALHTFSNIEYCAYFVSATFAYTFVLHESTERNNLKCTP